jgi:hypothetical protein
MFGIRPRPANLGLQAARCAILHTRLVQGGRHLRAAIHTPIQCFFRTTRQDESEGGNYGTFSSVVKFVVVIRLEGREGGG